MDTRRATVLLHAKQQRDLSQAFAAAVLAGDASAEVPTPGLRDSSRPIGDLLLDTITPAELVALVHAAATKPDCRLHGRILLSLLGARFGDEHADYAVLAIVEGSQA